MVELNELQKQAKDGFDALTDFMLEHLPVKPELIKKIRESDPQNLMGEHYPYEERISKRQYEEEKYQLQIELVKWQKHIKREGLKHSIIFEGRDAAGKGGTIKRFLEHLNPRGARVVALLRPSEKEAGQWYFQRYVQNLPTAGEIIFFDRSWYNRAGVERVMGFCSEEQYQDFVEQCPMFEKMLLSSNIHLDKFWFSVSQEEQLRRFIQRLLDPLKQWKLSPMDIESLGRWNDYTHAKEYMFHHTDKKVSPWIVIRSDDKRRARLNAMRYILNKYDYMDKDKSVIEKPDPKILGSALDIYEAGELEHRELLNT